MGPGDIESSLSLRAGLRQASQGHAALKEMAASEDADDAARVEMEIQLRTQESAKKRVTKLGAVRAADRARASFQVWSISPDPAIFQYTPAELARAGAVVTAGHQTSRSCDVASLEFPVFKLLAALNGKAVGF